MSKASTVYTIYWDNTLVGISTYLPLPNGGLKYAWRNSRLVILPDYQNLGIGTKALEFLGEYYLSKGLKYFDRSSHLRLKKHWDNSPLWKATSHNEQKRTDVIGQKDNFNWKYDTSRICASFEYMGKDYAEKEHIEIYIDDTKDINYTLLEEDLRLLKENYYITVTTGEINTPSEIENICLKLGIRTQLLYSSSKGITKINTKYKSKKIITVWDKNFSDEVKEYYNLKK